MQKPVVFDSFSFFIQFLHKLKSYFCLHSPFPEVVGNTARLKEKKVRKGVCRGV